MKILKQYLKNIMLVKRIRFQNIEWMSFPYSSLFICGLDYLFFIIQACQKPCVVYYALSWLEWTKQDDYVQNIIYKFIIKINASNDILISS